MPLYLYKCKTCGYEEEVLQSFNESPPLCPKCCWNPECEGDAKIMERQLSKRTGFILRGSGWYRTDYKKLGSDKKDEKTKTPPGGVAKDKDVV